MSFFSFFKTLLAAPQRTRAGHGVMDNLEAVLPLKISGERERHSLALAKTLLLSLSHFHRDSRDLQVTIVCPEAELAAVKAALARRKGVVLSFVAEEELVPEFGSHPTVNGWFKQMIVKLAFSKIATRPFYMTLDADVICVRPYSQETFIEAGRAITEWERMSLHPEWWSGSATLLGLPTHQSDSRWGFSVTPNILAKPLAAHALRAVARACRKSAATALIEHSDFARFAWSEYALYMLAAERSRKLDRYHLTQTEMRDTRRSRLQDPGASLWHLGMKSFEAWNPAKWVEETTRGHFVLCQSNLGSDPEAIWSKVSPLFEDRSASTHSQPHTVALEK